VCVNGKFVFTLQRKPRLTDSSDGVSADADDLLTVRNGPHLTVAVAHFNDARLTARRHGDQTLDRRHWLPFHALMK